jgi:hypothetical protein
MLKCKRITIESNQKYECLINHHRTIIECKPDSEHLLYGNIDELFKKYRKVVKFTLIGEVDHPMVLNEDNYEAMVIKSPIIDKLKDRFDCVM